MKNAEPKMKLIKTRKNIGTMYCLGCKDYTDNSKPQEVKMTNKMFREKSNCVACWSSKSRFLKQELIQRQHKLYSFFKLQRHGYVL